MSSNSRDPVEVSPSISAASGKVARLVDRLSSINNSSSITPMAAPLKKAPKILNTAQVRFSYTAAQDDELTLAENDLIEVLEDVEDGWARGKLNGRIGLFPTNFVSFTPAQTPSTVSYSAVPLNEEKKEHQSAAKQLSNLSTNSNKKDDDDEVFQKTKNSSTSSENNVLPSILKAKKSNELSGEKREYAKVLYDYTAEHPDELDLKEGEVIALFNRKTADEGWYEGEINGRRGLFPENFVRIMPALDTRMSAEPSSNFSATPPPVLPAKPAKPFLVGKPSTNGERKEQNSPTQPSSPSLLSNGSSSNIANKAKELVKERQSSASDHSPPRTNTHTTIEERKSMIAGLQSKLFPQGKLPPHKPTFTPPSNTLTASVHGSLTSTSKDAEEKEGNQNIPPVHLRHSVMDPTRLLLPQQNLPQLQTEEKSSDEETKQLESLTKMRPKMPNKRPPSSHFRQSKLTTAPDSSTEIPVSAAKEEQEHKTQPSPVSTPTSTVFPSQPSPSTQPQPSPTKDQGTHRGLEVQNVVKELASVTSSLKDKQMGNKASKSSADSTVSAAEFEEFRSEVFKRLEVLEAKVEKLLTK